VTVTLRGMTWNHPRGFDPMVAAAEAWLDRTGVAILWDKRSLQDFETFPVEQLARAYDLIVIDHPHVGQITADKCLLPLDRPGRDAAIAAIHEGSVGQSYASYSWEGRQWAFPIDAAAQVQVYRADLVEPARTWGDVVRLAQGGHVVLPMLAPHSLMCLFTLAANLGHACGRDGVLVDDHVGAEAVARLAALTPFIEQSNFAMDPIAASEAMARADAVVSLMPLGYGYVSYARDGFRPKRLTFTDIPLPGHAGSALGGTGIAVSAFSAHPDDAADFATWVAGGEVQRGLYAQAGGQPGHAAAWDDDVVNRDSHDFYRGTRATLEKSYVRPRHNGYMAFQDAASRRLNAGLLTREPPKSIVADLNRLYRESL
jgi:multiple sugar transport system substrate-binding protein